MHRACIHQIMPSSSRIKLRKSIIKNKCYFSNYSSDELKVLFILIVNVRIGIWLEGVSTLWRQEKTVIWVEYFFWKDDKPFTWETTSINSFFAFKFYSETWFKLVRLQLINCIVWINQHFLSSDSTVHLSYRLFLSNTSNFQ
jgi:hypothetical protein